MAHKRTAGIGAGAAAAVLAVVLLAGVLLAVVLRDDPEPAWAKSAPTPAPIADHPRGGSVRIAVSTPAELSDTGVGGDTLRSLIRPHLFDPQPDGTWRPSLVEPGSDHGSKDGLTATFRLRNARWSNGDAIAVDDLKRNADARFVAGIDGPDVDGVITLRFTRPTPQWRQLWSGDAYVEPADEALSAGPYRVSSVQSGLETVLSRNDAWFGRGGSQAPFLDEVRLVVVPDALMARMLLAKSDVDVVSPPAETSRTSRLRAIDGVTVSVATSGGNWTALRLSDRLPEDQRARIASTVLKKEFAAAVLPGEATVLDGFGTDVWKNGVASNGKDLPKSAVELRLPIDSPVSDQFGESFEYGVKTIGGNPKSIGVEASEIAKRSQSGDYDVLMASGRSGPDRCWQCLLGDVDADLAARADSGDASAAKRLQEKARSSALFLPLWSENTVTAFRSSVVAGVTPNGYAPGAAWNAALWWRP